MPRATCFSFLRVSHFRLSGGAAKPQWDVPRAQLWGPARGDRHHYGEHPSYNYFVLFLRGVRPKVEHAAQGAASIVKNVALGVLNPARTFVKAHNPDLRLQLVALASFTLTSAFLTGRFGKIYQNIIDLTSLLEFQAASLYESEGFWVTKAAERRQREELVAKHKERLEQTWQRAIAAADEAKSFEVLCTFLEPLNSSVDGADDDNSADSTREADCCQHTVPILPPVSWRFELMPYGENNEDTQTFPVPDSEKPLRAFSLSFTSNNLSGNWGDYINRQDNKNAIMRPSRQMFTDVYIGPTK